MILHQEGIDFPIGFYGQFESKGVVFFREKSSWRPFDTFLNQFLSPNVEEIIQDPKNWVEISKIHGYKKVGKIPKSNYLDNFQDWLKLSNIHFKGDSIAVEKNIELRKNERRPKMANGFNSDHQLLGPFVKISLGTIHKLRGHMWVQMYRKYCQKVVEKAPYKCRKVTKKLPKVCRKVAQKVAKMLLKGCHKLPKSCRIVVEKVPK